MLGKMQNNGLFTGRLEFEPTTQMIDLWGPNSLVLQSFPFVFAKPSDLSDSWPSFLFVSWRASLAIHRLNLALAYFEKAIDNVIAAKGDGTPDLISLYQEVAQIEQLRRNHDQAIQYLKQVSELSLAGVQVVYPKATEACVSQGTTRGIGLIAFEL